MISVHYSVPFQSRTIYGKERFFSRMTYVIILLLYIFLTFLFQMWRYKLYIMIYIYISATECAFTKWRCKSMGWERHANKMSGLGPLCACFFFPILQHPFVLNKQKVSFVYVFVDFLQHDKIIWRIH